MTLTVENARYSDGWAADTDEAASMNERVAWSGGRVPL